MTFDRDGYSDPWTIQYEETIFVVNGQARLIVSESPGDREVFGNPGDLLVLPKGLTVQYGGDVGTRLLLSISPVNWRETTDD
jgi:ethanolamine utilization protein EutQ (cupin superfamily)